MPAISDVSLWNTEDGRKAADAEFVARRAMVGKYRGYYDGVFPAQLNDDKDNVVINLCKQVVDETAAFIAPDMPNIELDEEAGVTSDDESALAEVWAMSGGARLVNQMAVGGGVAGHVFVRVVVGMGERVRIVNLNAANIIRWWLSSDYTVTMGYELRWRSGKTEYRTDVIRDGNGWVIRDWSRKYEERSSAQNSPAWTGGDEMRWDYPIAPIVDWQHLPKIGEAYGQNEIPHAELNLHVNKIASDIKSILRYHAYPTTVGTGFSAGDVQETRIGGFMTIPDPQAKVYNVEMQSDLASSMEMFNTLRDAFFNQARVVVVKGGLDTFRGMTNLGIRAAFMPMIAKTAQLRRNYTDGIVALSRLVLMLYGKDADVVMDLPIKVMWGDALPSDEREKIELLERQQRNGWISAREASTRMGNDYDKQVKWIKEEAILQNEIMNGVGDNIG